MARQEPHIFAPIIYLLCCFFLLCSDMRYCLYKSALGLAPLGSYTDVGPSTSGGVASPDGGYAASLAHNDVEVPGALMQGSLPYVSFHSLIPHHIPKARNRRAAVGLPVSHSGFPGG